MDAGEPVSAADLRRALDVREGLRAVLLQNNGLPLDEAAGRAARPRGAARGVRVRFGQDATPSWWPTPGAWTARSRG